VSIWVRSTTKEDGEFLKKAEAVKTLILRSFPSTLDGIGGEHREKERVKVKTDRIPRYERASRGGGNKSQKRRTRKKEIRPLNARVCPEGMKGRRRGCSEKNHSGMLSPLFGDSFPGKKSLQARRMGRKKLRSSRFAHDGRRERKRHE